MQTDRNGSVLKRHVLGFLKYIIIIIVMITIIFPIYAALAGSFKTDNEFLNSNVMLLPKSLRFQNYHKALFDNSMLIGFKNTAVIIAFSCIGTVFTGSTTAFVLQRFKSSLGNYTKALFAIATLLPTISMQVTIFHTINSLGLIDSIFAPVLLYIGADIVSISIFMQYLNNIPVSLDECAFVDGASYPKIFVKIILPQLKPAINLVVIIKAITIYNDFFVPALYLRSNKNTVISTALYRMVSPYSTDWEVVCAGIIICIIPTLILFFALKRYIYGSIINASIKEIF